MEIIEIKKNKMESNIILDNNIQYILLISLYDETDKIRFNELLTVLKMNIINIYIKQIVVLYERNRGLFDTIFNEYSNKIKVFLINKRPSYNDIFNTANNFFKNEQCIVSNSDIIFDETLKNIPTFFLNKISCITRNNIKNIITNSDNIIKFNYSDMNNNSSQDTWLFTAPIKLLNHDIIIGTFTCDSFINAQLIHRKEKYYNISNYVKIYHLQNGVSDSQKVHNCKNEYFINYINEIRKDNIRLCVCGVPKVEEIINNEIEPIYCYPHGSIGSCKTKNCEGCNSCIFTKFYNISFYESDLKYSEENPLHINFTEPFIFSSLEDEDQNLDNIYKIEYSIDNINFNLIDIKYRNKNIILFKENIEATFFKVYYTNLFELNLNEDSFNKFMNINIIISGIGKNIEPNCNLLFETLKIIQHHFSRSVTYIYENDSTDNTSNILKKITPDFSNETHKIEICCERNITCPGKYIHYSIMALARQKCLNFINSKSSNIYSHVLLIDLDLHIPIYIKSLYKAFIERNNFDVQFANGIYTKNNNYWDSFALRTKDFNIPFYDKIVDGKNTYWSDVSNTAQAQAPLIEDFTPVISAFGGMALYNKECFKISNYNYDANDCEHVSFHEKLFNLGKTLVINKNFIKRYSDKETNGSFYKNNKYISYINY